MARLVVLGLSLVCDFYVARTFCGADDDNTFGAFVQQQLGQSYSCAQMILQNDQTQLCDDEGIAGVCCSSCQHVISDREALRTRLLPQQDELRSLLHQADWRLRSPPLHGSGPGMPLIAFGASGTIGKAGQDILQFALESGIVHLDTALMYGTHKEVR